MQDDIDSILKATELTNDDFLKDSKKTQITHKNQIANKTQHFSDDLHNYITLFSKQKSWQMMTF